MSTATDNLSSALEIKGRDATAITWWRLGVSHIAVIQWLRVAHWALRGIGGELYAFSTVYAMKGWMSE